MSVKIEPTGQEQSPCWEWKMSWNTSQRPPWMKEIIVDKLPPAVQAVSSVPDVAMQAAGQEVKKIVQKDLVRHIAKFLLEQRFDNLDGSALLEAKNYYGPDGWNTSDYALRLHILTPAELEVALQMAYDAGWNARDRAL